MESEFPIPESDFPDVINLSNSQVASIQAELVRASSSQIKQLSAMEVDLRDSFAIVIDADTVNARKTGIAHIEGGNLTLLDGNVLVAKTDSMVLSGRAGVVVADSAGFENGYAGVLVSRDVRGENIRTGILLSRNVQGNVETTMDTRTAVLTGIVAGAVVGTFLMLGQFLFRRK